MVGFARGGRSLRVARCIEVSVLVVGWLLGGTVGIDRVVRVDDHHRPPDRPRSLAFPRDHPERILGRLTRLVRTR